MPSVRTNAATAALAEARERANRGRENLGELVMCRRNA
jgi:hypothetical protein